MANALLFGDHAPPVIGLVWPAIWQGRIWSAGGGDTDTGWGQPYNGGGVYDPDEATGGHFDHIHVSFRR